LPGKTIALMGITANLQALKQEIPSYVTLVAVSKTKSDKDILEAYHAGQRIFGENKVQELSSKMVRLPGDIQWHMIGHLQTNKVKQIISSVQMIHSVDSLRLLETINKEAKRIQRVIPCLLQFHIASEQTKFGFDYKEAVEIVKSMDLLALKNISLQGVMGMATFSEDENLIKKEFQSLNQIFQKLKEEYFLCSPDFKFLSMGMSGDYRLAIGEGSNMIRVGSNIFGER
jgi:PLP dependent protein